MQNPWERLPLEAPYVLAEDRALIDTFNRSCSEARTIHTEILPEPFLGQPDAPIVLLNLNPGFSTSDFENHSRPEFAQANRGNLLHTKAEYPFYLLDPRWDPTPGYRWWTKRLRRLVEPFDLRQVASSLLCVEFFPYHSKKFGHRNLRLPCQTYSFELVLRAIDREALVLLLRGERAWFEAVPALAGYERLHRTNSVQNVTVSPRNCPSCFEQIIGILKSAEDSQAT